MNQTFGWCVIGCGKLAHIVAEQITASGRHRIVSAYSRREASAQEFVSRHGGTAYADARRAVSAPGVDAVYVVTPHSSHYEYAALALEMGKPVLCEKAFTVRGEDTRRLIALAEEKGLYLAEAMWTWFAPAAHQVKKWLDAGEVGRIDTVEVSCRGNGQGYAPRVTDPMAAGGALLDMGVYAITYLYRLFGKPDGVRCEGVVQHGIDWEEDITLHFPTGEEWRTSVSIRDPKGVQRVTIRGDKGVIRVDGFHYADEAVLTRCDGTSITFRGSGNYLNEFDIVAREIRQGLRQSRFVPLSATLDVMRIMDECRAQLGLIYPFETT